MTTKPTTPTTPIPADITLDEAKALIGRWVIATTQNTFVILGAASMEPRRHPTNNPNHRN